MKHEGQQDETWTRPMGNPNQGEPAHRKEHLQSSAATRDIFIGMSDGLMVPFALAAGLSGAVSSNNIIVIAGIVQICASAIAMGLGGYKAAKTELGHHTSDMRQEYAEADQVRRRQMEEAKGFFAGIGLSEELQEKAAEEIAKDKDKWMEFLMEHEIGLNKTDPARAVRSAIIIAASYVVGGLVPLSPYFFPVTPLDALKISALATLACLLVFGFFRSRITGLNPWLGALRVAVIGAVAAAAAFGVARIFAGQG